MSLSRSREGQGQGQIEVSLDPTFLNICGEFGRRIRYNLQFTNNLLGAFVCGEMEASTHYVFYTHKKTPLIWLERRQY